MPTTNRNNRPKSKKPLLNSPNKANKNCWATSNPPNETSHPPSVRHHPKRIRVERNRRAAVRKETKKRKQSESVADPIATTKATHKDDSTQSQIPHQENKLTEYQTRTKETQTQQQRAFEKEEQQRVGACPFFSFKTKDRATTKKPRIAWTISDLF